jgi:amino acid transporter
MTPAVPPNSGTGCDSDEVVHLRANAIGFFGALAESVSNVGPSAGIALIISVMFVTAGNGTWLSWVITSAILLAVAYCCSQVLTRFTTAGGLIGIVDTTGFKISAVAVAGCVLAFGVFASPANVLGTGLLFQNWFNAIGVGSSHWLLLGISLAAIILGFGLAARDIGLSAHVMLVLEFVTLGLIGVLMTIVLVNHHGSIFDTRQLQLHGVSLHQVLLGSVAGMFAVVSFECSATLGDETRDPRKTIPRSLFGSVAVAAFVFITASYVMTLGFEGLKGGLAASADPLGDLAKMNGVGWLRYIALLGVAVSYFGVVVAFTNWTARVMYTLARDGALPRYFAKIDSRTRTPLRATLTLAAIATVYIIVFVISGNATLTVFGYMATAGGLMYTIGYVIALATLGVDGFVKRRNVLVLIAGGFGAAGFAYAIYNSVNPLPPYPLSLWTLVGVGVGVASIFAGVVLWLTRARVLATFGQSVREDTALAEVAELDETDDEPFLPASRTATMATAAAINGPGGQQ